MGILRNMRNVENISLSDQQGLPNPIYEGERIIAITVKFKGNLLIYLTKSFSLDEFMISMHYNSLMAEPNELYICSVLHDVRRAVLSVDGDFVLQQGSCDMDAAD